MNPNYEKILSRYRSKAAVTEERCNRLIEEYRKGQFAVVVKNADDTPCPGAKIEVEQTSSDFKFGANCFLVGEFDTPEENALYEKRFAEVFNLATVPFYWNTLEPEEGKPRFAADSEKIYRRPAPDLCLEFCERNGIMPKAHCLNYSCFTPDWARGDVAFEKAKLAKRFETLAARYAGRIRDWEVTNETFGWHKRPVATIGSFYLNGKDYVEWSFDTAAKFFPGNRLVINEDRPHTFKSGDWASFACGWRHPYRLLIERALAHGCRIDSIGMQYHMFGSLEGEAAQTEYLHDPDEEWRLFDGFSDLGIPLQITETTFSSWADGEEAEEFQAELLRDHFTVWFAHPAMEQIIYWNLVDGYTFGKKRDMTSGENTCRGGLLHSDLSPKKSYETLRELVCEKWRTKLSSESDADGLLRFRGFKGDYKGRVTAPNGETKEIVFHISNDTPVSAVVKFGTEK